MRHKQAGTLLNALTRAAMNLCFMASPAMAHAGDSVVGEPPPIFDTLWQIPDIYHSDENPAVQDFTFIGRYHGQQWVVSSGGNSETGWENRRMILGFKASLFNRFRLESQFAIAEDFDPFYDGLYVTFLEWENSEGTVSVRPCWTPGLPVQRRRRVEQCVRTL